MQGKQDLLQTIRVTAQLAALQDSSHLVTEETRGKGRNTTPSSHTEMRPTPFLRASPCLGSGISGALPGHKVQTWELCSFAVSARPFLFKASVSSLQALTPPVPSRKIKHPAPACPCPHWSLPSLVFDFPDPWPHWSLPSLVPDFPGSCPH